MALLTGTADGEAISGTVDDDTIQGLGGDDVLTGSDGSDVLNGGAGHDTLYGGLNDDTLLGGDGANRLEDHDGSNVFTCGDGSDTIVSTGSGSQLIQLGETTVRQDATVNNATGLTITAGSGDELVYLADITGIADIALGDGFNEMRIWRAETVSITGGNGSEYVDMTNINDLRANLSGGSDTIGGYNITGEIDLGDGNDTVNIAQTFNVLITGGLGVDTYSFDKGNAVGVSKNCNVRITDFTTGAGGDIVVLKHIVSALENYSGGNPFGTGHLRAVQSGDDILVQVDFNGEIGGENYDTFLTLLGADAATLSGANFSGYTPDGLPVSGVSIDGAADHEALVGTVGDDTIRGLGGWDNLLGDNGSDLLDGGDDPDFIDGGLGDDTMFGGSGADDLRDHLGSNVFFGGDGDDGIFSASAGHQWVDTGGGDNRVTLNYSSSVSVSAFEGNDTILINNIIGSAWISAGDGANLVNVYNVAGPLSIISGNDADQISAAIAGDVYLDTGAGVDTVRSQILTGEINLGEGDDNISIDISDILITGGLGVDTYSFIEVSYLKSGQQGNVRIADFTVGTGGDVLEFASVLGGLVNYTGGNLFGTEHLRVVQSGDDALVQMDFDGPDAPGRFVTLFTLLNTDSSLLTGANFGGYTPDGSSVAGRATHGTSSADNLTGTVGDDLIKGFGANDSLIGGNGSDRIDGGDGNDTVDGGFGHDILIGGEGDDRLVDNYGANRFYGEAGNDYIYSTSSSDQRVSAGEGNNSIILYNANGAFVTAGGGDDYLRLSSVAGDIIVNLRDGSNRIVMEYMLGTTSKVRTGSGDDNFEGRYVSGLNLTMGAGSDIFTGYITTGTVDLGAGDDSVYLSSGHNITFTGGEGIDTYRYTSADYITEAGGQGDTRITDFAAGAGGDVIIISPIVALLSNYSGDDPFADGYLRLLQFNSTTIFQVDFDGAASGRGWSNVITLLNMDASTLTIENFDGYAPSVSSISGFVFGSMANDTLAGTDAADTMFGLGGHDSISGLDEADAIDGGAGNDTLIGGLGSDTLDGSSGRNWLDGGVGDDLLIGGLGVNLLRGGAGRDTVTYSTASAGVEVSLALTSYQQTAGGYDKLVKVENLIGSDFGDRLVGGSTGNRLEGGGGNDTLIGGLGHDTLVGGKGSDTFVFDLADSPLTGWDVILDLEASDSIDLSAIDAISGTVENDAFILVGEFSSNAGEAVLFYNPANDVTYLLLDVDGDGVADFRVTMIGDHQDFAGLTL